MESADSSAPSSPTESPEELRPNGEEECEDEEEEEGEQSEDNGCLLDEEANEEYVCQICNDVFKQPRLLNCLHRFCTACVQGQVEQEDGDVCLDDPLQALKAAAGQQAGYSVVTCPTCKQETRLGDGGVEGLQLDYVLMNALDVCAIEKKQIVCTSCKAKEKAVARCQDCANFLCPNCVTAHQYMRCFENHKVESFEDMQKQNGDGLSIHKPLFCPVHPSESMKYYCTTCQAPICSECVAGGHPPPKHVYLRISDVEPDQRVELQAQVTESQSKIGECEHASEALERMLSELQMQRDNAKGMVEETFQTYKAMLDKKREDTVTELEKLHSEQELNIMELFHNVEKTIEKIEDGCKFAENVVKRGNAIELLLLKKTISTQLQSLIDNTPKPEVNVKIEFETDSDKFQQALDQHFGMFKKSDAEKDAEKSAHSSFENEPGLNLPANLLGSQAAAGLLPNVNPADFMMPPPLSMPDMGAGVPVSVSPGNMVPGVSQQTINHIASSLQNLSQPADRSSSRNSYSPAMSDSGISIGGEQGSSNSGRYDVRTLAKLGTIGVNRQGQVTLNDQVLPGIDIHNAVGLPSAMTNSSAISIGGPAAEQATGNTGHYNVRDLNRLGTVGVNRHGQVTLNDQVLPGIDIHNAVGLPASMYAAAAAHSRSTPTDLSDPTANYLSSIALPPTSSASSFRPTTPQLSDIPDLFPSTFTNPNLLAAAAASVNTNEFEPMVTGLTLAGGSAYKAPGQPPYPVRDASKMTAMQIRSKFGQLGPGKGQFNSPHGFCLGIDEDIVTADTNNHRIQVFEKTGEWKYMFGIPGREEGQLWYPRKVAAIRTMGRYVVCDRGNERSRMQLFTRAGHFIRKIAIRYIDIVAGLAITQEGYIAAVDSVSPTVFVIDPESSVGELVRWFDCSDYMREPSDIAIRGKEYYVCDFKGHCVVAFSEEGHYLRRIGCDTITNYPNGIDVSDAGDILVGDSHGNRFHVAVFSRQGELTGEFQCPYVKVSRCCGLKITTEGYVVTLAKNNHHVLVLGTLYLA